MKSCERLFAAGLVAAIGFVAMAIVSGPAYSVCCSTPVPPSITCLDKTSTATGVLQSGDVVTYTIRLGSSGTGPISNVQLVDPIPVGVTYKDNTVDPAGSCIVNGTVSCDFGTQDAGWSQNVQFDVIVDPVSQETEIVNVATLSATDHKNAQCSTKINVEPTPVDQIACRVTGGGGDGYEHDTGVWNGTWGEGHSNDGKGQNVNWYTFGGQGGANSAINPTKGEWTHHQQKGPAGKFIFHGGTASAPQGTQISLIECSDPGYCSPAREAPAKQIDFHGVGSFKNITTDDPLLNGVVVGNLYGFSVHIEDLGEPGNNGRQKKAGPSCPDYGHDGLNGVFAECEDGCPDYYRLKIFDSSTLVDGRPTGSMIYQVEGYIENGNFQIHPPTGFDTQASN